MKLRTFLIRFVSVFNSLLPEAKPVGLVQTSVFYFAERQAILVIMRRNLVQQGIKGFKELGDSRN